MLIHSVRRFHDRGCGTVNRTGGSQWAGDGRMASSVFNDAARALEKRSRKKARLPHRLPAPVLLFLEIEKHWNACQNHGAPNQGTAEILRKG